MMAGNKQRPETGSIGSRGRLFGRTIFGTIFVGFLYMALVNGISGAEEGRIANGLAEQLGLPREEVNVELPFDTNPYDSNEQPKPRATIEGLGPCLLEISYLTPEPGAPQLQLVDTTPADDPLDGWLVMDVNADGTMREASTTSISDMLDNACAVPQD